ncbi:hypothetical protein EB235_19260 [Mesorhizobium loti R88b]|uniref:Uncharacterized protein n=2 Tax=Rhizobium loti TaxID=381 RepID=A0A6M7WLQ6_RHILI|nr:hypothetical protein EB235_19260 [Mesorhizobium loti R88b]
MYSLLVSYLYYRDVVLDVKPGNDRLLALSKQIDGLNSRIAPLQQLSDFVKKECANVDAVKVSKVNFCKDLTDNYLKNIN